MRIWIRLQQEASKKIAELAERAHSEAISNLDETSRSVYKENVRVNAALEYHVKEGDFLKKEKERLETQNTDLLSEKELNGMIVQEKIVESKQQKKLLKELREKVQTLEQSLSHVVREFEDERMTLLKNAREETKASRAEIARLQRVNEMKSREMTRVKRLAKNILDQRTDIERFFLDSLEYVKNEITSNRAQYRRDAQNAYQQRMLEAHTGRAEYPRVRTFKPSDSSTNNVFDDLKEAERWTGMEGKIDVGDLTWEQRERVLRMLFAKMNGHKDKKRHKHVPSLEGPSSEFRAVEGETKDSTFITQGAIAAQSSEAQDCKLPPPLPPGGQIVASALA